MNQPPAPTTHLSIAVVEWAPNAMLMVDNQGMIVLTNMGAQTLFGYRREELLGQPVDVLVPERFRDQQSDLRAGLFSVASTLVKMSALVPSSWRREQIGCCDQALRLSPRPADRAVRCILVSGKA
jgi:hypothetical protein